MRPCRTCGSTNRTPGGRCRPCQVAGQQRFRAENPEAAKTLDRRNKLRKKYGITEADYASMDESQAGLCAICGKPETRRSNAGTGALKALAVDHDQDTGQVRGLLCQQCNVGIGCFEDEPDRLLAAAAYLMAAAEKLIDK